MKATLRSHRVITSMMLQKLTLPLGTFMLRSYKSFDCFQNILSLDEFTLQFSH